jgi:vancomycin resistance protein YoaR
VTPVSARFAIGFALGLFGTLFVAGAAVFGLSQAYDGKIMPGVRAGTVDLSGLTRDEAISKLDSGYVSLGQGKIVITTPGGKGTITYQEAGRGPDSAAIVDAALALGRADNPLGSLALTVRTFAVGSSVPIVVKLDPTALETRLHQMTGASLVPPKNASVAISGTDHEILPAAVGRGIDENVIATQLIDQLSSTDAPAELQVGAKFVTIEPTVSDADAQAAAASVGKMSVAVTLTNGDKTWTIEAATVHSWIIFGARTNGTYLPAVNPALVSTFVATLAKDVNVDPVEPRVIYKDGQPNGLSAGKPGTALDVDATAQAIEVYLDGLGSGGSPSETNLAFVVNDVPPKLEANPDLAGFVRIGQWVTTYFPGESNGNGVNIQLPAELLNGMVIGPGKSFSFLNAVGPIDEGHGWKMGGVILDGKSNHTGAIGGGICSASTTFFNAAARAGLQIDERHAHFYYNNRYPVGLDATVFSNGSTTLDMRWTNDTDYPIVIRSWWSGGGTRVIHVELWSLPLGRTTTFAGGVKKDIVKASDGTQYVPSLPGSQKTYRAEYPTDGYNTVVTRTVTDKSGAIIHSDTWSSRYAKVDGLLQIVGTPPPSLTPSPTAGPPTPPPASPPPTPAPTPAPTPGPPTPPPATPPPTPAPTPAPTLRRRPNRR